MARTVTPAIVLRTVDYGEADRVVTLLCQAGGKRSALARGARKSARRFGAGLALFGVGEATLSERPGSELATLESFHGARGFPRLTQDVAKVAHGGYACELVRELSPPHKDEPEVFALLVQFLDLLDGGAARAETLRIFELALLDAVGLRPTLDRCVECGSDSIDGEGQVFDVRKGGVVCGSCRGHGRPVYGPAAPRLDGETRQTLAQAQAMKLGTELSLAPAVNAACREILAAVLLDHLGKPLKSVEFIAKLNAS
jgi:DNA repair protein RecO (recombination protein O)